MFVLFNILITGAWGRSADQTQKNRRFVMAEALEVKRLCTVFRIRGFLSFVKNALQNWVSLKTQHNRGICQACLQVRVTFPALLFFNTVMWLKKTPYSSEKGECFWSWLSLPASCLISPSAHSIQTPNLILLFIFSNVLTFFFDLGFSFLLHLLTFDFFAAFASAYAFYKQIHLH